MKIVGYQKTIITADTIRNISYHNFDTSGDNDSRKFNWKMRLNIQRVLYMSGRKANNCEVLLVMHVPTSRMEITTNYSDMEVYLTPTMKMALFNDCGPFVAVHNHPNNSFFSVSDLMTFLSYASLQSCYVVGNNGRVIHLMVKESNKSKNGFYVKISRLLVFLCKIGMINKHGNAKPYLDLLKNKGIRYKTYYER